MLSVLARYDSKISVTLKSSHANHKFSGSPAFKRLSLLSSWIRFFYSTADENHSKRTFNRFLFCSILFIFRMPCLLVFHSKFISHVEVSSKLVFFLFFPQYILFSILWEKKKNTFSPHWDNHKPLTMVTFHADMKREPVWMEIRKE